MTATGEPTVEQLQAEIATLRADAERRDRLLAEVLEQQTATSEILRVIASSPTDLERVLDAVAQSAVNLSNSSGGVLLLSQNGQLEVVATVGSYIEAVAIGGRHQISAHAPNGAAMLECRTIHIDDRSAPWVRTTFPAITGPVFTSATLSVPLRARGDAIGVFQVARDRAEPYLPQDIALIETFADQAVVAIENARLFKELQEANQQLAEASQHKSQFLANMSHELRTPLNAIIGYSEMLQEEAEDTGTDDFVPDLQRINSAGKHLLGLINDILDLSKIEAGRMDLYLETFSITDLIRDVTAIVRPLVEKNGNELEVHCPDDIGVMHADQTKVRQALFNLLSNAAKFTNHGRIALRVRRQEGGGADRSGVKHDADGLHVEAGRLGLHPDGDVNRKPAPTEPGRVGAGFQATMRSIDPPNLPASASTPSMDPPNLPTSASTPSMDPPNLPASSASTPSMDLPNLPASAPIPSGHNPNPPDSQNPLVTFAVADTGIGMTEEQLGRLFEAFSQAEASTRSQYGGTGLGLAISRHFCRLMGGDLTVTSHHGHGSTFTISLPLAVQAPTA